MKHIAQSEPYGRCVAAGSERRASPQKNLSDKLRKMMNNSVWQLCSSTLSNIYYSENVNTEGVDTSQNKDVGGRGFGNNYSVNLEPKWPRHVE